jgi:hypothetical protein
MIRLKDLLSEIIKGRKSTFGEYIRIDFTDNSKPIGYTNIRLKKGWNQLHIDVEELQRGKGYAQQMIEYNINEYNYVTFPDDRITNPIMEKIIEKFKSNSKYEVFRTSYDETVISNKKQSKQEILDKLK